MNAVCRLPVAHQIVVAAISGTMRVNQWIASCKIDLFVDVNDQIGEKGSGDLPLFLCEG